MPKQKNKEIHTFVFEGVLEANTNPFAIEFLGMESVAWAKGDALEAKMHLETFIRDLSFGDVENPVEAANKLKKKMGWS